MLDGRPRRFHYVWLRDNSWAADDRVRQSGERKLFTASIPPGIAPTAASFDPERGLEVLWNDGQAATYSPGLAAPLRLLPRRAGSPAAAP